jgi:small subunit ribosomal protein S1
MNSDSNRISLGMKQLMSDPWKDAEHAYYVGQKIHGHVVRFAPFGVIVELEGDIEATIHTSELADKKVKHPSEVVNIGDDIEAIVTNVNANDRRMNLSLRQLKKQIEEKQEHEVVATYAAKVGEAGASTIGERMAQLRIDAAAAEAEAEAEEAVEAAEPAEAVEASEPAEAVEASEPADTVEAVEAPEEPKEA